MVAVGQVVTGGGAPHTHAWADVTGEPDFALTGHAHAIADVTGLQEEIDSSATLAGLNETNLRVGALELAPPAHVHDYATAASVSAVASDVTALDGRVDALEAAPATPWPLKRWDGAAYVDATDARIYVGATDPGVMPEGSVWIGPA